MTKIHRKGKFIFCFFSRKGGISKGNFSSLNCSYNVGEDKKNVLNNREKAKSLINSKKKIIFVNQIHSNKVVVINKISTTKLIRADAMISDRKDILLGILTADCAPIIALGKNYFGIIHAGWKGAISGIIENTINQLLTNGENLNELKFFVGPHLTKKSFEVKNDFISKLQKKNLDSKQFINENGGKSFFDFSKFLKNIFVNMKIKNFSISNLDTYANNKDYFSYRYFSKLGIKKCGRQISLVGIKS